MTKDFKGNTPAEKGQYGIGWMLGGIGVGLLAGLAIFTIVNQSSSSPSVPISTTSNNTTPSSALSTPVAETIVTEQLEEDSRPGFSYHAILPQITMDDAMKTVQIKEANPEPGVANQLSGIANAIDRPITTTPRPTAQTPSPPPAQPVATVTPELGGIQAANYMFQLGSYRSQAQAIQMQDRARRNGMNTRIEQANVNGQMWYRVRIGPTADVGIANRWRQSISGMGVEPYMIRM